MGAECTLAGIQLPPDIEWEDEGRWLPVGVVDTYSIRGAVIRQGSAMQSGRPVTLVARGDRHVWLRYDIVETLRALAATNIGTPMVLKLIDGREFSVIWRHADLAVEFAPVEYMVSHDATVQAARPYTLTLRLQQV